MSLAAPGAPATGEASRPLGSTPRPRSWRHLEHPRRLWFVAGAVVIALGVLLFEGLTSSLNYFETANQAVAKRASLGASTFNLEGTVVAGTVRQTAQGADFTVSNSGVSVRVVNVGSPPQLFRPGIPVVLVGHFSGGGDTFASSQIIVKHSASYVAAHPNRVKATNGSVQ
ncbi:MAG: cytochrome c maturation protein CcmE [Acidimicrobiales bacterium]